MKARRLTARKQVLIRQADGVFMLELLISLAVLLIFIGAMASQVQIAGQASVASQKAVIAATIAQELMDNTRNYGYDRLKKDYLGTEYELLINRQSASETSEAAYHPRPLQLDMINQTWRDASKVNKFTGRVWEKIEPGPTDNSLKITITIKWKELAGTNERTYVLSTLLAENGVHN